MGPGPGGGGHGGGHQGEKNGHGEQNKMADDGNRGNKDKTDEIEEQVGGERNRDSGLYSDKVGGTQYTNKGKDSTGLNVAWQHWFDQGWNSQRPIFQPWNRQRDYDQGYDRGRIPYRVETTTPREMRAKQGAVVSKFLTFFHASD